MISKTTVFFLIHVCPVESVLIMRELTVCEFGTYLSDQGRKVRKYMLVANNGGLAVVAFSYLELSECS